MLKFTVEGQKLELIGDPFVVADSFDYLTGEFRFYSGYDWDLTEKHVFFQFGEGTPYEVVLVDNKFVKTDHVNLTTGTWSIYVIGYDINGATLVERITTNKVSLTVDASGVQDGEPFPPSIIPDILVTVDQSTPQTIVNGVPRLEADRTITHDNELTDKKFVEDKVAEITADDFAHNSLSSLQGGTETERYHMTQAENAALHGHGNKAALDLVSGTNTGDQVAGDFNHNDLANKQGGSAGEYYHTTQAQNAALHAHSNKTALDAVSGTNTGDQTLPTRDSLGLDTDDTVTFANLSGTNTGDQDAADVSNTPAGNIAATTVQAALNELDTEKEAVANKVTSMTGASTNTQYPSAKSVYDSTMRLLISRTIGAEENVSAITWTQDDAGNALALIDADVVFHVPANTLSVGVLGHIGARINEYAGATDYQRTNVRQSFLLANQFRSNYGISVLRIRKTGGYAHAVMDYSAFDGTTPSSSSYQQNTIFTVATITNLYLYMVSGLAFFPKGTIIEIYGRTA